MIIGSDIARLHTIAEIGRLMDTHTIESPTGPLLAWPDLDTTRWVSLLVDALIPYPYPDTPKEVAMSFETEREYQLAKRELDRLSSRVLDGAAQHWRRLINEAVLAYDQARPGASLS